MAADAQAYLGGELDSVIAGGYWNTFSRSYTRRLCDATFIYQVICILFRFVYLKLKLDITVVLTVAIVAYDVCSCQKQPHDMFAFCSLVKFSKGVNVIGVNARAQG